MKNGGLNRPPYPTGLLVDIHSYCNAKCSICPYTHLSKKNPMGFMRWDLYIKILDDFKKLMDTYGFQGKLSYCQMGEPFFLKGIPKWIKNATDRGIEVYINTNASLLSPDVVDSLIEIEFDGIINLSFHGISKEIYEKTMGLDFDKTMLNIEYLLQHYPIEKIQVNAVSFNWPPGEKERLKEFWSNRGVKVTISKALSRSGLSPKIKQTLRKRIAGCRTERVFYEMVIAFNGDVLLCCHDMAREIILGNLNEFTIADIWNGEKFLHILNKIYFDRKLPPGFICKRCEESEPYLSIRKKVKKIIPEKLKQKIREKRKSQWIVTDGRATK